MADALGVNKTALAEWFPPLERAIVSRMNERLSESRESLIEGRGRRDG